MCPFSILLFPIIILVFALVIISRRTTYDKADANSQIFIGLVEQATFKKGLLGSGFTIEGFYKGRKVILRFIMGGDNSDIFDLSMEVRANPQKQKLVIFRYPRPTENTELRGNLLRYISRRGIFNPFPPLYTEEEYRQMLEELSRVAVKIEGNRLNAL